MTLGTNSLSSSLFSCTLGFHKDPKDVCVFILSAAKRRPYLAHSKDLPRFPEVPSAATVVCTRGRERELR